MLRRIAILSVCALALALVGSVAANAESRTLVDARRDVWAMDTQGVGQDTRAPEHREGDILRTVFVHNNRLVVIRTKFSEFDRVGSKFIMAIKLRTSTGVHRIDLLAGPSRATNRWRGIVTRHHRQDPMKCASHRIEYATDVAEVRIPRSCLGGPRWVQGSLAAGSVVRNGTLYGDNPVTDGPTVHLPRYTARIHMG